MKPYYQDLHNTLYCLDFRENDLPDESVQMVVTSPPYWGLRKYSGEQELIWGDGDCEHQWGVEFLGDTRAYGAGIGQWQDGSAEGGRPHYKVSQGNFCSLCGAWKGAYGLESTPGMYIEHTIEILREIRRVLRKDGVVFWNIGDSYVSSASGSLPSESWQRPSRLAAMERPSKLAKGLKPKDLCLIPFRLAIAAQEDGWWVRSVIIWSKPNPMPESVTDRPTESHEYILMLTKSARYYWDADAVREPHESSEETRRLIGGKPSNARYSEASDYGVSTGTRMGQNPSGRNIRTVWEFPTQPYPEAHFAVFPEKLPETCIKAATPEVGCCSKCGAPWERVTKVLRSNESYWGRQGKTPQDVKGIGKYGDAVASDGDRKRVGSDIRLGPTVSVETLGWQPTCKCNASRVPSMVLDPFAGAGTTLWKAKTLGRKAVGFEISEEYCRLIVERNRQQVFT